jgi:hypothetical protein
MRGAPPVRSGPSPPALRRERAPWRSRLASLRASARTIEADDIAGSSRAGQIHACTSGSKRTAKNLKKDSQAFPPKANLPGARRRSHAVTIRHSLAPCACVPSLISPSPGMTSSHIDNRMRLARRAALGPCEHGLRGAWPALPLPLSCQRRHGGPSRQVENRL